MNFKRLQRKVEYGGLGLPNIRLYKDAFTCVQIVSMLDEKSKKPAWVNLETEICTPFDPTDYLSQCSNFHTNPIMNHSRDVWQQLHKRKGLSPFNSWKCFIMEQSKPEDRGKDCFLKRMALSWYKTLKTILAKAIKSFQDLKQEFNIKNTDFWKYLQLRTCLQKLQSIIPSLNKESPILSKF